MRSGFVGFSDRRRRVVPAAVAALTAVAVLAGCASEAVPEPEPEPTVAPVETPVAPPVAPVNLIVPKVCDAAFSLDQEDYFYDKQLVMNPDFLVDPDVPVVPAEVLSTVESWDPLVCTWTLPMASDYAIVVSFAAVEEAAAQGVVNTLEDLGFARSEQFDGTRLTLNVFADQNEAGFPSSDAHYVGRGIWVGVYSGEPNEAQTVLDATIEYLISESRA